MKIVLILSVIVGVSMLCAFMPTRVDNISTTKPTLSIVLCDVSGTVTTPKKTTSQSSLSLVLAHVDQLTSKYYPANSVILFLPVSTNRHAQILQEIKFKRGTVADRTRIRQEIEDQVKKLKASLQSLSVTESAHSCILTSIENAYDIFLNRSRNDKFSKEKFNYELVILSDFIEDCRDSPLKSLNMERNIDESISRINSLESEVNLDYLKINLRTVVCSNIVSAEFSRKIKQFWRVAFKKMKYSRTDELIFSSDL